MGQEWFQSTKTWGFSFMTSWEKKQKDFMNRSKNGFRHKIQPILNEDIQFIHLFFLFCFSFHFISFSRLLKNNAIVSHLFTGILGPGFHFELPNPRPWKWGWKNRQISLQMWVDITLTKRIEIGTALVDLYDATNGANWTNTVQNNMIWDVSNHLSNPCQWYGVICNSAGTSVTLLWVEQIFSFPSFLEKYQTQMFIAADGHSMQTSVLNQTNLSGTIPSSISNLSNLNVL